MNDEKRMLLTPGDCSDNGCVAAWRKLRSEFWTTDLMRAIYGGIVLGHIDFGFEFWSPKKHHTDFAFLGESVQPVQVDSSGTMYQGVRIPFSDIRRLLELHSFNQQELAAHGYEHDQTNALHLLVQIGLVDPDETGLRYGRDGEPLPA